MSIVFGGIEAGGTKFVCAVGTGPDDIRAEIRLPTESPEITLGKVIDFFRAQQEQHEIAAIGVASFGPVDPEPNSATFGHITNTPKPGWANTPVAATLKEAFGVPIGFDTDVNVAALGEHSWGAARGVDTFVYLTIGTGIGVMTVNIGFMAIVAGGINARFDDVNARIGDVETRLGARIDELSRHVNARFDDVNARFDDVNARIDDVNARVDDLQADEPEEREHGRPCAKRVQISRMPGHECSLSLRLRRRGHIVAVQSALYARRRRASAGPGASLAQL